MDTTKPPTASPLALSGPLPLRPALAIARFQGTLAAAVGQPGIGADEAGFLADLQAVLNYMASLEANALRVTRSDPTAPDETQLGFSSDHLRKLN